MVRWGEQNLHVCDAPPFFFCLKALCGYHDNKPDRYLHTLIHEGHVYVMKHLSVLKGNSV